MLCHPIQRYKFESNSQQPLLVEARHAGCVTRYKDTNLKAIHNSISFEYFCILLCHPIQKYKFESDDIILNVILFVFLMCQHL